MARVLVLEQPSPGNIDLSPASRFGELVYLLDRKVDRVSAFDTARYEQLIRERLCDVGFNPASDVVCLAGKILGVAVLCATLARIYGPFQALMFDAHETKYVKRVIGERINGRNPEFTDTEAPAAR